jgi:hypothetical protein
MLSMVFDNNISDGLEVAVLTIESAIDVGLKLFENSFNLEDLGGAKLVLTDPDLDRTCLLRIFTCNFRRVSACERYSYIIIFVSSADLSHAQCLSSVIRKPL